MTANASQEQILQEVNTGSLGKSSLSNHLLKRLKKSREKLTDVTFTIILVKNYFENWTMEEVSFHLRNRIDSRETTTDFQTVTSTIKPVNEKESTADTIYGPLPEIPIDSKEENRDNYVFTLKMVLSFCSASFAFLLIR